MPSLHQHHSEGVAGCQNVAFCVLVTDAVPRGTISFNNAFETHANVQQMKRCDGAGREDMDVKMLGRGRPFVLQIINPRKGIPPQEVLQRVQGQIAEVTICQSMGPLQALRTIMSD